MSSMSPPPPTNASSPAAPTPAKKARANGGGGPGPGRPKKNKTAAAAGGDGADGSTTATKTTKGKAAGGTGAGRGRKKRQSTIDSPGVSTPHSAGIAFNPNTPGGGSSHAPSPAPGGIAGIASMLEDEARMAREGSQASGSASRKGGAATAGRSNAGGRDTTTVAGEDDEEEEEEDEEDDEFFNDNEYDEQAKERAEAKEALRMLVDQFSPEQLRRYEVYRGARLQSAPIRRLINHVLQQSCSPNIIIAVRGLSKVFVGEIVELARQVQTEADETGPITPDHLREAYVRYKAVGDKRGSSRAKLFVR